MTQAGFRAWDLDWTPDHIGRFWNWYGTNPALAGNYFSKMVGDALLDRIRRLISLDGTVVDLGCGPGYMVERLLRRGVRTLAVDTSPESVALLAQRLQGSPNFLGARVSSMDHVPLDNDVADTVLLIETVEHLHDDVLNNVLAEARRILKPSGCIVVTTPNNEKLAEHNVMCPNCGCVFHPVQHVRSWTAESLGERMLAIGFVSVLCEATLFSLYPKLFRPLHRVAHAIRRAPLPHLLYIGRKP